MQHGLSRNVLLLALLLAACSVSMPDFSTLGRPPAPDESGLPALRQTIAGINLDAGIDYQEALAVAKYYLIRFVRVDPKIANLADQGSSWRAQMYSGVNGLGNQAVVIDKKTGRVSSPLGPVVPNLQRLVAD